MTRPPNKRISRAKPVRTAGGGKKGNGCPLTLLLLPLLLPLLLIYALVSLLALTPRARRYRPLHIARAGAAVGGTAGGSPLYAPATRLRQNAATAG